MTETQPPKSPPLGWYLKHHDGVQHGPFDWSKIVAGAKNKRLHASTQIMHPERTGGQWVQVSRLDGLAGYLEEVPTAPAPLSVSSANSVPQAAAPQFHESSAASAVPIRVRQAKRKKSNPFAAWLMSLLMFLAPTSAVLGLIVYQLGTEKVLAIFGRGSPNRLGEAETVQPDSPIPTSSTQSSARPLTASAATQVDDKPDSNDGTVSDNNAPAGNDDRNAMRPNALTDQEREARRRRLEEFGRMGRGESTVVASTTPDGTIRGEDFAVPLTLKRDRFSMEVPAEIMSRTDADRPRFIVEGIERVVGEIKAIPSSRLLTVDTPVRMTISSMPTFGIEIKLLDAKKSNGSPTISLNMRFRPTGPEPVGFTLDRIERSVRFVGKNLQASQVQLNQLATERAGRDAYVKSRQIKPLDMVNAAKNRVAVLDKQIAAANGMIASQRTTLTQLNDMTSIATAISEGPGLILVPLKTK